MHGSKKGDTDPPHLAALRAKLDEFKGEDIRDRVEKEGSDHVIRQLGLNVQELLLLREQDPEVFEAFSTSQLAAQINTGMFDPEHNDNQED